MKVRLTNGTKQCGIELPADGAWLTWKMNRLEMDDSCPQCTLTWVREVYNPLNTLVGTVVDINELNFLTKRLETMRLYDWRVMSAYLSVHEAHDVITMINLTYSMEGLSWLEDESMADKEAVGKQLYMDRHREVSSLEDTKIDFAAYADEVLGNSLVMEVMGGFYVENCFSMREAYNGRTFPLHVYGPDNAIIYLEIGNRAGDIEYLYLPTDIGSFDKMKRRLGAEWFQECAVKRIHNCCMPEEVFRCLPPVHNIKELSVLNGICRSVEQIGEKTTLSYEVDDYEPLEINPAEYGVFRLWSLLKGELVMDGGQPILLRGKELLEFEAEIMRCIRAKHYMIGSARGIANRFENLMLEAKIVSAVPMVKAYGEELYGVLTCSIQEPLNDREQELLKEAWREEMRNGWGEGMEMEEVETGRGQIYICFASSGDEWSVVTEEELCNGQGQRSPEQSM